MRLRRRIRDALHFVPMPSLVDSKPAARSRPARTETNKHARRDRPAADDPNAHLAAAGLGMRAIAVSGKGARRVLIGPQPAQLDHGPRCIDAPLRRIIRFTRRRELGCAMLDLFRH